MPLEIAFGHQRRTFLSDAQLKTFSITHCVFVFLQRASKKRKEEKKNTPNC